jgi:transglutaminase-like putative cysteine protease
MAVYTRRRRTAREYLHLLEASGADYALLAMALFITQFLSGASIQQPQVGVILGLLCGVGCLVSFVFRRLMGGAPWLMKATWLQFGTFFATIVLLRPFNNALAEGGLPWALAPAIFLMLFLLIGSFLVWNDDTVMFMLVPAVSLFGIMSWLETAGTMGGLRVFDVSLVAFMVTLALLMFRLHLRLMFARAQAAGIERPDYLYRVPWRSVAGPGLAVLSILLICGVSWLAAPLVEAGVATVVGNPTLNFRPPQFGSSGISQERVSLEVGGGPTSASDLPVLRVRATGPVRYLRERTYDIYRGKGWQSQASMNRIRRAAARPQFVPGASVFLFRTPADTMVERTTATVEVVSRFHRFVYTPGLITRLEFDGQLRIAGGDRRYVLAEAIYSPGTKYYVEAVEFVPNPAILRSAPMVDPEQTARTYMVADRYDPDVVRLAREISAIGRTQYDKVMALKRYIESNCKYNLRASAITGDVDRVRAFLLERQEGYCDLFASSLAVLCRAAGIRARVVTGFLVDSESMEGDAYVIRDRHGHVWTEVYFEGVGWVPFDATEGAEAVPGAGVGSALTDEARSGFLARLIAVLSGVLIAFLGVLGVVLLRRSQKATRISVEQRALQSLYLDFMKLMRAFVHRARAPFETTREYVQATKAQLPDQETIFRLAARFDEAFYSPRGPTDDVLGEIRTDLDTLRRLRAEAK